MKTLAITVARQNLGYWLKRALAGEDIGIMVDGEIVGLRKVKVYSEDYAQLDYGLSSKELKRAVRNINKIAKHEKTRGWDGTAESLGG